MWWRKDRQERNGHYWRLYGLSKSAAAEKLDAQEGRCAICEVDVYLDDRSPRAQLDHCHASGQPRDFLCPRCNRGLGGFADDARLMEAAVRYLDAHAVTKIVDGNFRRPRRKQTLKGLPKNPQKHHHVLTESGRRVDLSDPNLAELMKNDVEVAEAVEQYVLHKASRR
jgi:hypothetical protein